VAKSPGGKSVGRTSVRVVPDTSKFAKELKAKLEGLEKKLKFKLEVALDDDRLSESVRKTARKAQDQVKKLPAKLPVEILDVEQIHLERLKKRVTDAAKKIEANIPVTADGENLRRDLQGKLSRIRDEMKLLIDPTLTEEQTIEFRHKIHQLIRSVEDDEAHIDVVANTAAATAHMRVVTRDRIVNLFLRVNKKSVATVATTIAALSGARLAGDWVERLARNIGELDKKLPSLSLWSSGITSLIAALLGSISGLVGIGQGLAAILPAFLLLPGLAAGFAASLVVFIIALKDAKKQLNELAPAMNEIAQIIRTNFWEQARKPIIDMVRNLLPQLRNSFSATSTAIGRFVGNFAKSFSAAFSNGRLESIFAGLADSFSILSAGTDAFAGAIASLGQVAALYMPRMARWFTLLSIDFDNWLTQVSSDGRLVEWMEGAIDAIQDVWDVAAATTSILTGLWRAAETAGSGGLAGFADTMQRIADVVNSPAFQSTLTALFRGSGAALEFFGDALGDVGDLLYDLRFFLEAFIKTAGQAFGGLISDIAKALNDPAVGQALVDFMVGVRDGLSGFGEYLPDIAQGFASLAGFAGSLAAVLGPVIGEVLAALAPVLEEILDALEPLLPLLGEALVDAVKELAPDLIELVQALLPLVPPLIELAVNALPLVVLGIQTLVSLLPLLQPGIDVLASLIDASAGMYGMANAFLTGSSAAEVTSGMLNGTFGPAMQAAGQALLDLMTGAAIAWGQIRATFQNSIGTLQATLQSWGQNARNLWNSVWATLASAVSTGMTNAGSAVSNGILTIAAYLYTLPGKVQSAVSGAGTWLFEAGKNIIQGLVNGIKSMISTAVSSVVNVGQSIIDGAKGVLGIKSPSRVFRDQVGHQVIEGLVIGLKRGQSRAASAMSDLLTLPEVPSFTADLGVVGGNGGRGGAGGSGTTVNQYITTREPEDPRLAARQWGREVGRELSAL